MEGQCRRREEEEKGGREGGRDKERGRKQKGGVCGGGRVKFTALIIHPLSALFTAFQHVGGGRLGSRT